MLQGEIGRNTLEQQARTGERLRSAGFSQASKLAQDAATQQLRQAQLAGGLSQGIAGLGQLGQQMAGQDISTLLGIGGLQQQQAQQGLNVAQQNALGQQQLPFQQLGFLGDIFRGANYTAAAESDVADSWPWYCRSWCLWSGPAGSWLLREIRMARRSLSRPMFRVPGASRQAAGIFLYLARSLSKLHSET